MSEVKPITRENFLAAYVDANPYDYCYAASAAWNELHNRHLLKDEIDEDPS